MYIPIIHLRITKNIIFDLLSVRPMTAKPWKQQSILVLGKLYSEMLLPWGIPVALS